MSKERGSVCLGSVVDQECEPRCSPDAAQSPCEAVRRPSLDEVKEIDNVRINRGIVVEL